MDFEQEIEEEIHGRDDDDYPYDDDQDDIDNTSSTRDDAEHGMGNLVDGGVDPVDVQADSLDRQDGVRGAAAGGACPAPIQ